MRSLMRLMKPGTFEDITAVTALYRPGPMGMNSHTNHALRKNGLQEITPVHPELEEPLREVLDLTYGLVVYQEQVQKAAQEREMLGLYVSDHPLFGIEHILSDKADAAIAQLTAGEHADGAIVTIGGIISGLQRKMTEQGNAWAIATVEDLAGSIDCMFFPATYQLISTQLVEDTVVFVRGRLDKREDMPRLVATVCPEFWADLKAAVAVTQTT
ncbi:DNA polymerase III alpha subunit [Streptosporangium album]|uniref:DNA polymerase III alpha subunit n=1 Tax=Streptosporangium album TaxID=47479 RepID=A0A7W7RUP9_9ACTN|nr:DNA polymerase III alpha subunit [Streptosporangium album]